MDEPDGPLDGEDSWAAELARASADHQPDRDAIELMVARALGDGVATVLTLLDEGRASAARGHDTAAAIAFGRAADLARRTASAERSGRGAPAERRRWPLSRMVEALREAGLEDAASEVEELSGTAGNRAEVVQAHNVVQVGVVHGGIHIAGGTGGRTGEHLHVSVVTVQDENTCYEFEGVRVYPDREVAIFVEAFTAQAVLLHRLRAVFVRVVNTIAPDQERMMPREFELDLDRSLPVPPVPAREYDIDVRDQALSPQGDAADFPFFVTASAPEYFVVRPKRRGELRPVEWRLELDWSCLGQRGTIPIGHSYRPFLSGD
ncbi:hypothetical protein [Amycolatopsis lexingtonensis]|uniref:hypothetical protein n=1 Tax=Amycolatopsis lexingtonensis TaxID=218822 RepID=UPI003F72FFB7